MMSTFGMTVVIPEVDRVLEDGLEVFSSVNKLSDVHWQMHFGDTFYAPTYKHHRSPEVLSDLNLGSLHLKSFQWPTSTS